MAESRTATVRSGFGVTMRRDAWWVELIPVVVILGAFTVYATWRTFENNYYEFGPYLSPFYSPLIKPKWWPLSPAILILWAPLGFRATCYYYRKAYYRAFFLDPPGCAVGESHPHRYSGETRCPFILQNLHRYFLYVAIVFLFILWYDAIAAFWFPSATGKHFGIGIGSLVLLVNIILLTGYTLSCHSLMHIVGATVDCFSCVIPCGPQHGHWCRVSFWSGRLMPFLWPISDSLS